MKKFDLNALGVEEMNENELTIANGGFGPVDLLIAAGLTLFFDAVFSGSESVNAIEAGYESRNRY